MLYTGASGLVAHECILDLRELTRTTGVTVDDVAKRLIDYGFHAPTMSFPVAGTLMVEPTESEDLRELDRFVEALIAIKGEIDQVASGAWPPGDNPLVNAPHTATSVTGEWAHPYSRAEAAFPAGVDPRPSTGRRCVVSTAPTAIETSSVPARRSPSTPEVLDCLSRPVDRDQSTDFVVYRPNRYFDHGSPESDHGADFRRPNGNSTRGMIPGVCRSWRLTRHRATRQGGAVKDGASRRGWLPQRAGRVRHAAFGRRSGRALSTVYRHLQSFADDGVVDVIHTRDGETTYRYCGEPGRGPPSPPGLPGVRPG